MIDVVGRLPVKVRAATSSSATPSARSSSAVLPKASAWVCAKKLASSSSWTSTPCPSTSSVNAYAGLANAMKSAGTSRVPWWISW